VPNFKPPYLSETLHRAKNVEIGLLNFFLKIFLMMGKFFSKKVNTRMPACRRAFQGSFKSKEESIFLNEFSISYITLKFRKLKFFHLQERNQLNFFSHNNLAQVTRYPENSAFYEVGWPLKNYENSTL
jgi:hypothetical protein